MEILLGFLLTFIIVMFTIGIALAILMTVATWKLFTKAGIEGWKCLIPIYNAILIYQLAGINLWWIAILVGTSFLTLIFPLFGLLNFVVAVYFSILYSVSVARSYGKEDAFAVGLIFLPMVFFPILAFGKSKYLGPRPMNDMIFGNNNYQNTNNNNSNYNNYSNNTTNNNQSVKEANLVCSNCNNPVTPETAYCTKCGTKI